MTRSSTQLEEDKQRYADLVEEYDIDLAELTADTTS